MITPTKFTYQLNKDNNATQRNIVLKLKHVVMLFAIAKVQHVCTRTYVCRQSYLFCLEIYCILKEFMTKKILINLACCVWQAMNEYDGNIHISMMHNYCSIPLRYCLIFITFFFISYYSCLLGKQWKTKQEFLVACHVIGYIKVKNAATAAAASNNFMKNIS